LIRVKNGSRVGMHDRSGIRDDGWYAYARALFWFLQAVPACNAGVALLSTDFGTLVAD
jgi:hypothetical protein